MMVVFGKQMEALVVVDILCLSMEPLLFYKVFWYEFVDLIETFLWSVLLFEALSFSSNLRLIGYVEGSFGSLLRVDKLSL